VTAAYRPPYPYLPRDFAGSSDPSRLRELGQEPGQGGPPLAPDYFAGSRSLLISPADVFPIPGAQEFFRSADFSSPAAGFVSPAGLQLQLPPGTVARIATFAYGLINMTTTTNLTWALLIGGVPASGYEARRIFARNLPAITVQEDAYIRVPAGARISVTLTNVDGAAYTAYAAFAGWMYSEADALRWTGGQGS
jgi:hypothetical protein